MKNILFVVFISMIFLFVCCNTTTNKNIIETEISDFDKILDSLFVKYFSIVIFIYIILAERDKRFYIR